MRHVLGRDTAASIHAREIVHAVLAAATHPRADESACAQHSHDLLVRALENVSPRIADDGVETIAESIGLHGHRAERYFQSLFLIHVDYSTFAPESFTTFPHLTASSFT